MKKKLTVIFLICILSSYSQSNNSSNKKYKTLYEIHHPDESIYNLVATDKKPFFNKGKEGFEDFINKNYRRTSNMTEGKVYVTFIVETDGSLSDINAIRDFGFGSGKEVVRVMKLSPKWTPGELDGKKVRVLYQTPILILKDYDFTNDDIELKITGKNNVGKDEYIISGIASGIKNGKTLVLETQDENGMGLVPKNTVKVENGRFEMKGKITEPAFYFIQLEGAQEKIPLILEKGEVTIAINKDSIQKSKVSGTYNNNEYAIFNNEMINIRKKLIDFQTSKMQLMNAAQQTKDTAVINKLMKEFTEIQQEVGNASKVTYLTYAETHPKSYISVLIIQGMLNDTSPDMIKVESLYNSLDESVKNTKAGKAIRKKLNE